MEEFETIWLRRGLFFHADIFHVMTYARPASDGRRSIIERGEAHIHIYIRL